MFNIARIRIARLREEMRSSSDAEENGSRIDTMMNIYHELGIQCINESNDWVFEHRSKDYKKQVREFNIDTN